MKYRILALFIIAVPLISTGQDSTWTWGRKLASSTPEVIHIDPLNNILGSIPYEKSIAIGDTVFSHNYFQKPFANQAVFRYNKSGHFLNAVDLHTVERQRLTVSGVVSDDRLNTYIAGSFEVRFYIDRSTVNHGRVPYIRRPEVFLLKLRPDLRLAWAGVVSGTSTDYCLGTGMCPEGDVVIATQHVANLNSTSVVWLNQDTIPCQNLTGMFARIDSTGKIIWIRSFTFLQNYASQVQMTAGSDGDFYETGFASGLVVGEDTLSIPWYMSSNLRPFLIRINADGDFTSASYVNWSAATVTDLCVTESGSRYFSAAIYDSAIIAGDTIVLPQDTLGAVIIRTDSLDHVDWYRMIRYKTPTTYPVSFRLATVQDSVYFATLCSGSFILEDSLYNTGDSVRIFSGIFNPQGNLVQQVFTNPTVDVDPTGLLADHCGNMVLGGTMRGDIVFGGDTIQSTGSSAMGFISKMCLFESGTIDLGPDTSAYTSFTIRGPNGYLNYCWNEGLSWEQDLTVTKTGTYHLQVSGKDLCWKEDSVFVLIRELPGIEEPMAGKLQIYPNPTSTIITIAPPSKGILSILNINGQLLMQQEITEISTTVNVSELKSGIYFVRLTSNRKVQVGKFIKQ